MRQLVRWVFVTAIILCAGSLKAHADPVMLTVQEASEVLAGCTALDGHDRVVKDGAQERVVREPYKFSGGFLLAVAKNITKLREVMTAYQTAHNAKVMELSEGKGSLDPNSDAARKIAVADAEILATKQTIDLVLISTKELGLDPPTSNPLPPSQIANLSKILMVDK